MIWLALALGVVIGACSIGAAWLVHMKPRTVYKVCSRCFRKVAADDSVIDGIFDDK